MSPLPADAADAAGASRPQQLGERAWSVSVSEPSEAGPATATAVPKSRSTEALERYSARLRPRRVIYVTALVVAALALLTIVKIAYSRGEISSVSLRTAGSAPPSVSLQTPTATLTRAWQSTDRTAIGQPYWHGTVVTFDKHTMRGRNALTGRVTWSYTRTDRTLCQAVQDQGVSIAVFELHGNCDQLTAVSTDRGIRAWDRTLDKDGAELNGHPTYSVVPLTLMLTTPGAIYAIDTSGGLDRWVFRQQGCTVHGALLGTDGALISQSCAARACADLKFCADGEQLVLRDASAGENTDSATNNRNPDQIKWLLRSSLVPATADQVISAITADGTNLVVLGAKKGATLRRLPLVSRSTTVTSVAASDADLVRIGATSYALIYADPRFTWHATTTALPTVAGTTSSTTPNLEAARLSVATSAGIGVVDPARGSLQRTYRVAAPLPGSLVYPFGTGFLVAGARTTYYR